MVKPNKILYYLGTLLMIFSAVVFIYIISPVLLIYLFPPKVATVSQKTGTYLTIPKIGAQAQVQENVDPFNKDEYKSVLKKNIAHAKETSLPGEAGTVFIFAHSSGPPWEITRLNTIFLRLNELKKGDTIRINKGKKVFTYTVSEKKEVYPSDVKYLLNTSKNQLILQTCTPIGTDWKRLLVFAQPE